MRAYCLQQWMKFQKVHLWYKKFWFIFAWYRIVIETKLNSYSSISHSILIFEVTQNLNNANFYKKETLNLFDLAGREKI